MTIPDPAVNDRSPDHHSSSALSAETYGVDTIPDAERTGRPRDIVAVLLGSNMSLGTIFFGWLPASFGLGFWATVSSLVVGVLIGTALLAPMALVSFRTATNLSTSSGAQFGVRGRLIGSFIGLMLSLGYVALVIWTGGAAVVDSLARLFGTPSGNGAYAFVFVVLAVLGTVLGVYGYRLLIGFNWYLAAGMAVLMVLGVAAYAGQFDSAPFVDGYALGDFWSTWALAAVAAGISGPVAYVTVLGDYSRYFSPSQHTSRAVLSYTALGLIGGLLIPSLFGAFTAFAARGADDYVGPLVAAAPMWFLVPLLLNGIFGTFGNAGLLLYSMGLDLDAIAARLTRIHATVLVAVIATVLLFLGYFAWDANDAVTAFVLMLTAVATPWAVITLIGFVRLRGTYDKDSLQVFNLRTRGGVYWFVGGWNPAATISWALGSTVGLLAVETPIYSGPLLSVFGGVDLSFILAGLTGAVAYGVLSASLDRSAILPAGRAHRH
jgi:purine-cytosine permease-like protein